MSMDSVWVHSLESHSYLKPKILDIIDNYEQVREKRPEGADATTGVVCKKTDFFDPEPARYFPLFFENAHSLFDEICHKYWASSFDVDYVWFHQYHFNEYDGWHMHSKSNISMAYLLEIPDLEYGTEFVDIQKNTTFQPKVSEGDVLIFPSHIIHRAPLIRSNIRKTTIGININLNYPNVDKINPIDPIFNYES